MIYWGKRALTLGPRETVALTALIVTHLYAVSSRQQSYDWLRCEEESGKMGKSTLIDLINQVQDIKNCFTTSYQTVVSYPDRPPKQKQYQTIRANKEYALWRARIEAELGMLTQDRTVDDIYKLFANCTQRTVIEWEYFEIGGWNGVKGE